MALDKLFFFPESYIHLRKELVAHWPEIWKDVGWAMAFDAEMFVEKMNKHTRGAFNVAVVTSDDQLRIGHICLQFLTYLRKARGEINP